MITAMTVEQVRERIPFIVSRPEDDPIRIAEELTLLYDVLSTIAVGQDDRQAARELAAACLEILPRAESVTAG